MGVTAVRPPSGQCPVTQGRVYECSVQAVARRNTPVLAALALRVQPVSHKQDPTAPQAPLQSFVYTGKDMESEARDLRKSARIQKTDPSPGLDCTHEEPECPAEGVKTRRSDVPGRAAAQRKTKSRAGGPRRGADGSRARRGFGGQETESEQWKV